MTAVATVRLLVVDDHEVVRMGLRSLLSTEGGFEVVAEAGSREEALSQAIACRPDLILLDHRLPDGDGVEFCRQVKALLPEVRVLFLTSFTTRDVVWAAVQAGADGFLIKEADAATLIDGIHRVMSGETVLHPNAVRELFRGMQQETETKRDLSRWEQLSPQERRVLAQVAEGRTNKEIGVGLNLSEKTVRNYLSNLMDKLGVSRRAEAAAFFARLQPEDVGDVGARPQS